MTITPDVDAFLAAAGPAEKQPGQWRRKGVDGPPYVTDPSGELVKSGARKGLPKLLQYGRPSGRGKIIENTYNLQKWGERMAMWGATLAPEIVADAGNITHEIDTAEWRRAMDTIAAQAKDAAQSMLAAHRGTHIHTLTEDDDEDRRWVNRMLAGEELGISHEAQKALVQAWRRMLAVHGFEILAVEAAVVCDRWRLAGTLDRIVRLTRDMRFTTSTGEIVTLPAGTVLILDLKTGKMTLDSGVIQYWQGYAVQLAAYALGVPYDVDAETRGTWPFKVSKEWAIIAHLDVLTAIEDGEARCTLVLCDLKAGIAAGDLCMAAVDWGRNDAVFSPPAANPEMVVSVPVPQPEPATDDDFDRANGEATSTTSTEESTSTSSTPSTEPPAPETTSSTPSAPPSSAPSTSITSASTRRQQILARLTALPDAQKVRIKAHWPIGVPALKSAQFNAEFDAIEAVIAAQTRTSMDVANLTPSQEEPCRSTPASSTSPSTDMRQPFSTSTSSSTNSTASSTSTEPRMPIEAGDWMAVAAGEDGPDEGPLVGDEDIAALRKAFSDLDTAEQLWLSIKSTESNRAGYVLNMAAGPTKRRWAIGTALVHLARLGVGDPHPKMSRKEVLERQHELAAMFENYEPTSSSDTHEATVRALLGVVMGEEVRPAIVTGTAVAALTIDEAERLAVLAQAVGAEAVVYFDEGGGLTSVEGPAVEAARAVA